MFIMTPTVRPHPATLKSANPYQERHRKTFCVSVRDVGTSP